MADTPDPQSVGRELVRQYYTMLNERPDCLHRFFSQNSSYVHGGVEKPGEELPPVKGQLAIHQKILSLGFKDCHAKIRQVDCQETVGGAVVIQVTGELSNNYGPMRRFMQTFVLARQSPKMFYLHNDIFRYQDEVFHDSDTTAADAGEEVDETEEQDFTEGDQVNTTGPESIQTVAPTSEQKASVTVNRSSDEPEKSHEVPDVPVELAPPAAAVDQHPSSTDNSATTVDTASVVEEKKETKSAEPADRETRTQLPVQKPFSWASLAGKGVTSSASSATTQAPPLPKPQATIKPERKADTNTSSTDQPQPQRAARSAPNRSDHAVINDSGADRKWPQSSFDGADSKTASGPVIPDNQQLFVGNLPHNAEDKDLIEFFSKFGNVIEVKINRKGMTRDLPNFGFVSFDGPDAVQKALSAKPLLLYGRHRLNVEEKKEQSELFGRPRGAGGRGGRGVGTYRGPYRGGRGGHFSAAGSSSGEAVSGSSN